MSDIESEKGTRGRANALLLDKLEGLDSAQRKTDKIIYMGIGGLAVLQFAAAVFLHK